MQVIKLGGSVITVKPKYKSYRKATVARLAREIARAKTPTIVVHGAGSFGHILAKKHNLNAGFSEVGQLKGFAEVHRDVRELNMLIIKELFRAGINAVSVQPGSFIRAEGGEVMSIDTRKFEEYLALGLCPVTFGDVVIDSQIGFCVCSGDTLVYHLAKDLQARRAIFVTDVDGIYGRMRGRHTVLPELRDISEIGHMKHDTKNEQNSTQKTSITIIGKNQKKTPDDVTGGIKGKARVMLTLGGHGVESVLINGNKTGRLRAVLVGEHVKGTYVRPGGSR